MSEPAEPQLRNVIAHAMAGEWHDTRFFGRGGAEYSMHRVADFVLRAIDKAGFVLVRKSDLEKRTYHFTLGNHGIEP